MKAVFLVTLAIACLLVLVAADYGYSYVPYYGGAYGASGASGGGWGNGGVLALIGLLFFIMILFGTNNTSTSARPNLIFLNNTK